MSFFYKTKKKWACTFVSKPDSMLKVFIVDDEQESITALKIKLSFCEVATKVVAVETDSRRAMKLLEDLDIDILFLDIEMPGINGIALLEPLTQRSYEVIMVTAFSEYAINAIKANAIDYLLKPVDVDELCVALKKVEMRKQHGSDENSLSEKLDSISAFLKMEKQEPQRIVVNSVKEVHFITTDQIIRVEGERNYSTFFLTNKTKVIATKTLKDYEETLLKANFYRIHKSHIINLAYLVKLNKGFDFSVVMSDDSIVEVSHRRKPDFLKYLETA
jgi:two-component system LytT family response regulator